MAEAYCVKCRKMVPMEHPTKKTLKNNRSMLQSICPTCHTRINKFVSKGTVVGAGLSF